MVKHLSNDEIRGMFSETVFNRGLKYYHEGRVKDLNYKQDSQVWVAKVIGSKTYRVRIDYDNMGISPECNCPAYDAYWEPCKHIAAVLLKISESNESKPSNQGNQSNQRISSLLDYNQNFQLFQQKRQEEEKKRLEEIERQRAEIQANYTKQLTDQFIQTIASYPREKLELDRIKTPLMVEWIIVLNKPYYNKAPYLSIEMKVGLKRTYVVKKIKDFVKAIKSQVQYPFAKGFTYDPTEQTFTLEDQEIIKLIQTAITLEETYREFHSSNYYAHGGYSNDRLLIIPPLVADELLTKLTALSVRYEINGHTYDNIQLYLSHLPFSIQLDKGKLDGFQLNLTELLSFNYLDSYGYIVSGNEFYKISEEQLMLIKELKKIVQQTGSPILPITNDQIETFISQAAPKIEKLGKLDIAENVSNKIVKYPLQAKLYVDSIEEQLHVSLEFHYGETKVNPFERVQLKDGPILMRDSDKEQAIMEIIESTSLRYNGKVLYIEGEEEIYDFLFEVLPLLEDKAEILTTNAIKSFILPIRQAPVTNIEVNHSGNWLDVNFDMAGIEQDMVKDILLSVVEKKKYYRLPTGVFISLESEEFQSIQSMIQEFHINKSQLQKGNIQLPIYRGMQLDELTGRENGNSAKYGKQFRKLLSRLRNPEELEFEVPDLLQADLREYQKYGFQWFKTLAYYRLGGILADEMGLGKTIQAIAFILSERSVDSNAKPALIVAPASLVYNWRNEFQKFAPSLTAEVIIGKPQDRIEFLQGNKVPDVWITSYPTLRQDIESYNGLEFNTLILDEAQYIKNYTTKTAKAVREIQARTCFALSGTPIENSIDELWSIFQTIMPDFFPNQKTFRHLDKGKVAKMIRPFILRRVKKDVLKELPDKIETVIYSELTNEQKSLYLAYLEKIQKESKESLLGEGFHKSRMKILAGLTRLRQLCCHPSLFIENYDGQSGKLEQLMEIISNAKDNGKRMLIFSQFTSMLAIIRDQLENINEPFFYLDGQTAPKDRVEMVDQFNKGETDIFLISLKAGNTGLNLTGADTVILYDLWWNPAVEEQAAGRAHRIGQKNVVQVIRLITQGTIEEKIYELQKNKKELIEAVVEPGDQVITAITEKEIREILNI